MGGYQELMNILLLADANCNWFALFQRSCCATHRRMQMRMEVSNAFLLFRCLIRSTSGLVVCWVRMNGGFCREREGGRHDNKKGIEVKENVLHLTKEEGCN